LSTELGWERFICAEILFHADGDEEGASLPLHKGVLRAIDAAVQVRINKCPMLNLF